MKFSRREFFKSGTIGGATLLFLSGYQQKEKSQVNYKYVSLDKKALKLPSKYALDLTPAKWIWFPSNRTLANTFILFRKSIKIQKSLYSAKGWILGESRYLLSVNGSRVQWGPPPADPRFSEADPIDLTNFLNTGENVIGANVLFYGYGDGTWPIGKPGFIFNLKLEFQDGTEEVIVTDASWKCAVARSWKPGQYKRWYLRALQEEFDARLYSYGWDKPNFDDESWHNAQGLRGAANKTALSSSSSDYMYESSNSSAVTELRKRSIPLILEKEYDDIHLVEAVEISWKRLPYEYFEMITPDSFEVVKLLSLPKVGAWSINLSEESKGILLTFNVYEQMVGWPFFKITAPEGTVVELMVQEAHKLYKDSGPALMNNHFNSWTRFICKEGENVFETFDYESIKWIQLHVHGIKGEVKIEGVGIRRRKYNWPNPPKIKTSDEELQQILDACLNTIYNNSLDTIVDGMGRERQQYSGDIGHVLHALYRVFGEEQLPARYLNTYSQGLTKDGFFLDCWPAYDRLNRLVQRQLDLTQWGPLLDHGVGFNFDCYYHYLYTGRLSDLEEIWPRLVRFYHYLKSIVRTDGMLPVEEIGIPAVWIDHDAYKRQRHKQCAFNLYAIAMSKYAFSTLAKLHGEPELGKDAMRFSDSLLQNVQSVYWDVDKKLFVCNRPWVSEEGEERYCDRSLATAILFDLCPDGHDQKAVKVLIDKPANVGLSYPPNANWYLWALGKAGNSNAILQDFHERWIRLQSIHENNTMQEAWNAKPDSSSQWSHAAIAPLFTIYSELAGIRPLKSGYRYFRIEPNPGKLERLELTNYTPAGPISFLIKGKPGKRKLNLEIPPRISGELVVDERENIRLKELYHHGSKKGYQLNGGHKLSFTLRFL